MSELEWFIRGMMFLLGGIVGSFLNVCIYRWPHEQSVVKPRSHCSQCKKTIPWYDNIPFLSYFILGGKCRFCKTSFSIRYVFIEFLTAGIFLGFYMYFGLSPVLLPYLLMVCGFIVATFVDLDHRIIPDEVSVGGMIAGIVLSFISPGLHDLSSSAMFYGQWTMYVIAALLLGAITLEYVLSRKKFDADYREHVVMVVAFLLGQWLMAVIAAKFGGLTANAMTAQAAIIGAFVGGGSIYLMGIMGDIIFKKESMGGGDVKLMAMVGAFLGWKLALLAFFIAPFFGAVIGIIEKIRTKDSTIAYGPYLVLGSLISLFYGDELIVWIMSGYGLY